MKFRKRLIALAWFASLSTVWSGAHAAQSGTWTPLSHPLCSNGQPCLAVSAPFPDGAVSAQLLLTDGTVIVHEPCGSQWLRLTPDITGSYVNGTWSVIASLPTGYAPLYYASQVLPDGRVIINGGEYNNNGSCDDAARVFTTQGAIYDPVSDAWTPVAPPPGWNFIGDAPSIVLGNGQYMLANCCTKQQAILDLDTMTWTSTGSNKADINSEEGWTLLRDGSVLTVDTSNAADQTHAERYLPNTGGWISAGSTVVQLSAYFVSSTTCPPPNVVSCEIGPQILLPNGTVFATGANANTSIYKPPGNINMPGTWTPGPLFPNISGRQFVAADSPAAVLIDGNVLVAAGIFQDGHFSPPTRFFEYDGTTLTPVADPPGAQSIGSYQYNLLVLPTGEVLLTNETADIEIYHPVGTFKQRWRPTIEQGPFTLVGGQTYQVYGRLFNGRSGGSAYGDDYQSATNYPLVRVTNLATGHVFYCRTFNWESITPTNDGRVHTDFTVPSNIELGDSQLEVVANGIPSKAKAASVIAVSKSSNLNRR